MSISATSDTSHDVERAFQEAFRLCQTGRFQEGQRIFRRILDTDPLHLDSLHWLGVACTQLGNHAEAIRHLDAALRIDANSAALHNSRGNILAALKRFEEALESFEKAIALDPGSGTAFHNRGSTYQELGQFEAAIGSYDQAIALDPADAEAHYGRGLALQSLHRFDEAVASYDSAIRLRPDHVQALINRGLVLDGSGRLSEAVESFEKAIEVQPDLAEAWNNRGATLQTLEQMNEALASYDKALALKPDFVEAWNNRGAALQALNQFEQAVASYDKALAINPGDSKAVINRGTALQKLRWFEQALASYERGIALEPHYAKSFVYRGDCLHQMARFQEAIDSYDKAIALDPHDAYGISKRGDALMGLRRYGEALADFERALAIDPDNRHASNGMAVAAAAACDWARVANISEELIMRVAAGVPAINPFTFLEYCSDPALQLVCAQTHVNDQIRVAPEPMWSGRIWRNEKIRVAYVATGFHEHPMAYLTAGLFELHDRSRFELIGISLGRKDTSEVRDRLVRAFDHFHDVRFKSDREVAALMHELKVDIAIDRSGHVMDSRPGIFAHRPAPIQVNYLGYPGTLGADFYDYVIADPIVLPFEHQPYFTEKIVHLPECYQACDSKRAMAAETSTREQAGLPTQGFVFCCFNNSSKITPVIFDIWMRLLQRVEGSVLWLLRTNALVETNLRKEAAGRGVDPARLVFADVLKVAQHLARHRLADLSLDTLPYNAHTTASDSLWAGLPLVTCYGESFPGRVAASLLHAVGLPELVTHSLEEYEALALRLATEPAMLSGIRERLQQNRSVYPLFDTDRYRRHIEAAYTKMWELWQRGEEPQSFSIDAEPAKLGTR